MRKATILFFLVLCVARYGLAESESKPFSYRLEVADGEYLFVMLSPDQRAKCEGPSTKTKEKICEYPSSGLYANDEPSQILWSVDFYAHRWDVFVSSNGKNLIRICSNAKRASKLEQELSQTAIAFYEKGSLIKEYLVSDLISDPKKLEYSGDNFVWKKNVSFDDFANELTVETVGGKTYVFNVLTGKITEKTP